MCVSACVMWRVGDGEDDRKLLIVASVGNSLVPEGAAPLERY